MVEHLRSLDHIYVENAWLTIGVFDGVHLGHQAILRTLSEGAHAVAATAVALSFHPHPAIVLGKKQGAFALTTPDERASLMGELGIDKVITYPFDQQTAATSARDFIRFLKERINFSWLGVGEDFALGRGRQGNVNFLLDLGEEYGYHLEIFSPIQMDGKIISSSRIREMLANGDMLGASRVLGRPYSLTGEVVHGDGRGRSIGIPTANLSVSSEKLIPVSGVYACRARVGEDEKVYPAAVNIGTRPTFDGDQAHSWVEAHLLDFSDDLYGCSIRLDFIEYLRGEHRFTHIQELIQQIQRDIHHTRSIIQG